MPKKRKIYCPNDAVHGKKYHASRQKLLMAYEENHGSPPTKFWLHCNDAACRSWVEINFNENGGVTVKRLKEKAPYFLKTPVIEVEG